MVLTLVTGGLWAIAWVYIAISAREDRIRLETDPLGQRLAEVCRSRLAPPLRKPPQRGARRTPNVAKALLNARPQVGGSIGTALFTTIYSSVSAASVAALDGPSERTEQLQALVAGYSAAFARSAVILVLAAPVMG